MPTATTVLRVLHVEDDPVQRALVGRHLRAMSDYEFDFAHADGEDAAVALFQQGRFDLVVLDYHLTQGNGLECLRRLRSLDPITPVIAVSGVATDEVAAQLIGTGADDYLGKRTIDSETLGQSVRNVLARARAFQNRCGSALNPSERPANERSASVPSNFPEDSPTS